MHEAHSHCHHCGTRYERKDEGSEWPKRCPPHAGGCGNLQWFNPKPIAVLIQPVVDGERIGVLTPIRGQDPMRGHPALTGGFQEGHDRSSEDAAARELWEEIRNERVREEDIELLCSRATGPLIAERRQNLVFGYSTRTVPISLFDGWEPDEETLAIDISWEPKVLAFPSHTYAMALYFRRHLGIEAPEAYFVHPHVGDPVFHGRGAPSVFDVPYIQRHLDEGIWEVLFEEDGMPVRIRHHEGGWKVA